MVARRLAHRVRDVDGEPEFFFTQPPHRGVPAAAEPIADLTAAFDEDPSIVAWTPSGIFFSASQRTWAYLFRLDPATKAVTRLAPTRSLDRLRLQPERRRADRRLHGERRVDIPGGLRRAGASTMARERKLDDDVATQVAIVAEHAPIEVVSLEEPGRREIEGVLHKPAGFQAGTPLSAAGRDPRRADGRLARRCRTAARGIYPIDLWVAKGALVLEPNYRGSAGYGEKFRSLNVRNLGVGDAWDVLSGIDYLVAKGWSIRDRVGAMGWSQGGYISAFLTTHDSATLQGDLGRRRHLELDDLLRQHRHPPVHAAVPQGDAVGRSRDLRRRPRR